MAVQPEPSPTTFRPQSAHIPGVVEREREENQHEYVNSNSGQGRAGHKAERGKNISVLDADIYAPNQSLFLSCLWPPWLFFLLLLRFQNTSESVDPLMNEVAEFVFQSALDDAS